MIFIVVDAMEQDTPRRIETWLWFGLIISPQIFYWFLLRKGHSTKARVWFGAYLFMRFVLWFMYIWPLIHDFFWPRPPLCEIDPTTCAELMKQQK